MENSCEFCGKKLTGILCCAAAAAKVQTLPIARPVQTVPSQFRNNVFRSEISDEAIREVELCRQSLHSLHTELSEWHEKNSADTARLKATERAWRRAGCPVVDSHQVEAANNNASAFRNAYDGINRELKQLQDRNQLLAFRNCVRRIGDRLDLPWWSLALGGGATVCFLFALAAVPFASTALAALWFSAWGFLVGTLLFGWLLLNPSDEELAKRTADLHQTIWLVEGRRKTAQSEMDAAENTASAMVLLHRIAADFEEARHAREFSLSRVISCESRFREQSAWLQHLETQYSHHNRLFRSNWRELQGVPFEEFCAEIFRLIGYDVSGTKASGDHGVDLVLTYGAAKIAIQAKGYPRTKVDNGAVQEAFSGMAIYGCSACAVITNSYFTDHAKDAARRLNCELVDGSTMESLIFGRIAFFRIA